MKVKVLRNFILAFLAHFQKMKVGFSDDLSVCVSSCASPTNNLWTAWSILMKFGMELMPFKSTSSQ
jgi:hypothetical protein